MKKFIALIFALGAALYLLTIGILPDPIPFLDEGLAMVILVKSLAVLGLDIGRWLPFVGRKSRLRPEGKVVDV